MKISAILAFSALVCSLASLPAQAQNRSAALKDRVNAAVNNNDRITLARNRHPLARAEFDRGRAAGDLRMDRMTLVLSPSKEQQDELDRLVADQQDPASPEYHHWLTPAEFGMRFGVSDADLSKIQAWLRSEGFTIDLVEASRRNIVFSGTGAQVEDAFHTAIHLYQVNGRLHHANSSDPEIPRAFSTVVNGIVSLHDFELAPQSINATPFYTSGSNHYLSPADFITIYNVGNLYNNSIDGTGQTIAILGRSNFSLSDVRSFRSRFGLLAKDPVVVLNGPDPGIVSTSEQQEASLDVEWSGAVARNGTVAFILSGSTQSTDGIVLSAQYAVNNNVAPVISLSFGSCELAMGSSGNSFWNLLWQQAAAQGISVLVSSGDSGSAGCDNASASTATHGTGVNGLCSSPYSTCVGGTQFSDTSNPSAYWSPSNSSSGLSALSYIPEAVWNQSGSAAGGSALWAGGGGKSIVYSKPSWQVAPGVPSDGVRDVPDVSLNASTHDGYLVVVNGSLLVFGGTSASAPSMAALLTLQNQKLGTRLGNANPILYGLAVLQSGGGAAVFHDTTSGSNAVPGTTGFNAGIGYDLASGLGSVDATLLVNHWTDASTPSPSFQVTASPTASLTQGANTQLTTQVTVSGGFSAAISLSLSGLPTGLTGSFSPPSFAAPGSGQSTLTLTAGTGLAAGVYNISILATSGPSVQTAPVAVTITAQTQVSGTPFVTGYALSNQVLRNDYGGFVGMKLTVGSSPLTVNSMGRICVAGNSGSHIVKFVQASSATDVPGASVTVNMAGCTPGQFQYVALSSSVTLSPATAYYLVTQETAGGDRWYDAGAIAVTPAAAVSFAIYQYSGVWFTNSGTNTSYVPPNFTYTVSGAQTVSVTINTNPSGLSFSVDGTPYSSGQVLQWTAGSQHTIATTSPQSGTTGTQFVWTGWSDSGAISHTVAPSSNTAYTAAFKTQYLLTTSISGPGTIAANPSSSNGYYDSGTIVQLTATPSPGYTFVGWSGDLSGTANPQSLTMSAPHSATATMQAQSTGGSGGTSFVTSSPAGTIRNDFTGWVGMRIAVGASPLSVSTVGRLCLAGNSGAHVVKLVNAANSADVSGGSAVVNMAGCTAGQFVFSSLSQPITLPAGASFFLASQETSGGDKWYDIRGISATTDAGITGGTWSSDGSHWNPAGSAGMSYGYPSFQYTLGSGSGSPQGSPFVSSFTASSLRTDFSGWVGMNFTVGSASLTPSYVGRICASGNSAVHTVKFVSASTGLDISGGSAQVSMAGCTPGQFVYTALSAPITLQSGTAYYLVSQEVASGDQWYDITTIVPSSSAAVTSGVYSYSGLWYQLGSANQSYVPPNFK